MRERLLFAGFGGQGIISMGKILAGAAVNTVPHVTFFPAYGAEVRGGTSHCQIILSSEEIASPVAETFTVLIIMNQMSADRFLHTAEANSLILLNSALCQPPVNKHCVAVPATDTANKLGDARAANFVMLGAMLARKELVAPEDLKKGIKTFFAEKSPTIADLNLKAFEAGYSG